MNAGADCLPPVHAFKAVATLTALKPSLGRLGGIWLSNIQPFGSGGIEVSDTLMKSCC